MLMLKLLLFSRTIRACSKTIQDKCEVEVVNTITIRTIILEVATSKTTTIKIPEVEAHIREEEVATIKVVTSRKLTAINQTTITVVLVEARTLRPLNARTMKWDHASMVIHAPSLMATRT